MAEDFTGTGFGVDIKEAKHEALADLSQSIKAEVRSSFSTYKAQKSDKIASETASKILVSSNLPILGAEFELFDNSDNVEALVALSPKKVQKLYAKKLHTLTDEIRVLQEKTRRTNQAVIKEELLSKLLSSLNEFERYQSVAIIVGVRDIPKIRVTKASVEYQLLELHHNLDSLDLAAKYLSEAFREYGKIYLYPPKV